MNTIDRFFPDITQYSGILWLKSSHTIFCGCYVKLFQSFRDSLNSFVLQVTELLQDSFQNPQRAVLSGHNVNHQTVGRQIYSILLLIGLWLAIVLQ